MDKTTNQELFKQALIEGVNRRIDRELASCEEEVVFSRKHIKAMSRIVKGKTPIKPINKKMIAILVAAAILLASCAIIYRDEIRDFITDVKEFFVKVTFDEGESESRNIKDVYELTYVPEGYELDSQSTMQMVVQYIYKNEAGYKIKFVQQPVDYFNFYVDSENDYDKFINKNGDEIYYRYTNGTYYYIWNDGKYALHIYSTEYLSEVMLQLILNGIQIK